MVCDVFQTTINHLSEIVWLDRILLYRGIEGHGRSLVFYVIFAMDGWILCEGIGETFPLQLFPLDLQSLEGAREREVFILIL